VSANHTLSQTEAQALYDRLGRGQDTQAFYEDPAFDVLIAHGAFGTAASILEIGCGTGRLAERVLRHHCSSTARYAGVDLSPRMVDIARDRLASFGDRARVVPSDGSFTFEGADGSQDRVVATYLLDLLSEADIHSFLAEAHRLLTTDGRLCLAGLTEGESLLGRFVTSFWTALHAVRPQWVGGCRPLRMRRFLEPDSWQVLHHEVVRRWGVPSEVLIATPA